MPGKNDDQTETQQGQTDSVDEESQNDAHEDEASSDEKERYERPDNLRRRAEWWQKRTGGR